MPVERRNCTELRSPASGGEVVPLSSRRQRKTLRRVREVEISIRTGASTDRLAGTFETKVSLGSMRSQETKEKRYGSI